MTSSNNGSPTLVMSSGAWVRFAEDAAERWLMAHGERLTDMQRFAAYMREMRYLSGYRLEAVANDLGLPVDQLALLEQGLLKPSEVQSGAWVRLMRLLEGRAELALPSAVEETPETPAPPVVEPAVEPAVVEPEVEEDPVLDPDVAWVMEEEEGEPEPEPASPPALPSTPAAASAIRPARQPESIGMARIVVVGIGGGGTNAVGRMFKQRVLGVEYIAVNTDQQHLKQLDLPVKIRIGDRLTRGLGVGGNPEIGREAAEESRAELYAILEGAEMVFLACGMGGGTGTGAAPVLAEIAREAGALTIATVTRPFAFEGRRRARQAEDGITRLRGKVDTLILIPNDRLSDLSDERMTADDAFRLADDVLRQGVQSIAELVTTPGEINLDFADIKTVMKGAGPAWMALGHGRGEHRALEAARMAMASPLLDVPVEGATRVLLNITGGTDLKLSEVQQAADYVAKLVDPEANIIFGMVTDTRMDDEVRVTVIATGIQGGEGMLDESLEQMLEETLEDEYYEDEEPEERQGFFRWLGFGRRDKR